MGRAARGESQAKLGSNGSLACIHFPRIARHARRSPGGDAYRKGQESRSRNIMVPGRQKCDCDDAPVPESPCLILLLCPWRFVRAVNYLYGSGSRPCRP